MKTIVLMLALTTVAFAHGGRTDSYGCHHNRKAGGYHCHSGPLAGQTFNSQVEMLKALRGSGTTSSAGSTEPTRGNPNAKVWVNTSSGVYHCPGTRWYGATKTGAYMTQREAQQKGNRPAYGNYCN